MIQSVTVINNLGDELTIELRRPEKSGFLISKIEGLGPPKASINTVVNTTNDGSTYNSAKVEQRNIVMTLYLLEHPTIEETRLLSYQYFPIKKPVTLIFETDTRLCSTVGYVESNSPNIFSSQESIQVSIICPDPYFYSYGESGTHRALFKWSFDSFEFPFSNESVDKPMIEFGTILENEYQNIYYEGNTEVGVVFHIRANGEASGITIFNKLTSETMKIDTGIIQKLTGEKLQKGDEIIISTVRRKRYARLLRNGVYTNIINCLEKDSSWFQLAPGDNIFAYTVKSGYENLEFEIENQIIFEGI